MNRTRHRSLAALLIACAAVASAPAANADSPTMLTVVGTSDVQDSGLMPNLITPMFQQAYPQYTLKYVSVGTGVAINDAETGVASALLVHAASLENQFVAQGFSAEKFGRAIFYGDYVLLGPTSDPAGVLANAPHDIAAAFARIAAAGAQHKADFVSRGGTPGTTVQEHAIWALDDGTAGLTLCTVSAANGGGEVPSAAGGACPSTASNPSWYHTTGLTQGPNVEAGNACSGALNTSGSSAPDCYVFTDRGTFQCLMSSTCSGGAVAPSNLQIVTRDQSPTAPGGGALLVNSFHAYAINAAKFAGNSNVQINTTAAQDFLNFITSSNFQAQLKSYLGATSDPPFIADASPSITPSTLPSKVVGGQQVTVTGFIANAVPGTPALAGQTVTVSELGSGLAAATPIASGKTDLSGGYRITFSPPSTGKYQVTTGQITQIENGQVAPVFGDLLQPAATAASKITVTGRIAGLSITGLPGRMLATGGVLPGSGHVKGSVQLLARFGTKGRFRLLGSESLLSNDDRFAVGVSAKPGVWFVEVRFQDPGLVVAVTTRARRVVIPPDGVASVRTGAVKLLGKGRYSLAGTVGGGAAGTVTVYALNAGPLPVAHSGASSSSVPPGTVAFRAVGSVKLSARRAAFSFRGTLTRGRHCLLMVRFVGAGSGGAAAGAIESARVT